jgi:hypothetical protein
MERESCDKLPCVDAVAQADALELGAPGLLGVAENKRYAAFRFPSFLISLSAII